MNSESVIGQKVHCKLPSSMRIQGPRNVVGDKDGSIYLLDEGFATILVWDKEGNFLTSVGVRGQGPGEMLMNGSMGCVTITNDSLIAVDNSNSKIHFWNRDFSFRKSIAKPPGYGRILSVQPLNTLYLVFSSSTKDSLQRLSIVDRDFVKINDIAVLSGNNYVRNNSGRWDFQPGADSLVFGFDNAEGIWFANSNETWAKKTNKNGDSLATLTLPSTRSKFNESEILVFQDDFKRWRQDGDTLVLPEYQTAVDIIIPFKDYIAFAQYSASDGRYEGKIMHLETKDELSVFSLTLGKFGFINKLGDGSIAAISIDTNGEYKLDVLEFLLKNM